MGWERPGPDSILPRGRPPPAATQLALSLCAQALHKVFDLTRGDGRRWSLRQDRRPGSLAPANVNQRQPRPPVPSTHPPLTSPHLTSTSSNPSPPSSSEISTTRSLPQSPSALRSARPTSAHKHMHMQVESHEAATCSSSFTHSPALSFIRPRACVHTVLLDYVSLPPSNPHRDPFVCAYAPTTMPTTPRRLLSRPQNMAQARRRCRVHTTP